MFKLRVIWYVRMNDDPRGKFRLLKSYGKIYIKKYVNQAYRTIWRGYLGRFVPQKMASKQYVVLNDVINKFNVVYYLFMHVTGINLLNIRHWNTEMSSKHCVIVTSIVLWHLHFVLATTLCCGNYIWLWHIHCAVVHR